MPRSRGPFGVQRADAASGWWWFVTHSIGGRVEPVVDMESDAEVGSWDAELESLLLRVGERFGRIEPRRRMRDYVRGLLGPVGRTNSWQMAEHAGNVTPYRLQRLLSWCQWDPDEIRDDLRDYVADQLGQPDGVEVPPLIGSR
jgi:hypothetical protein